MKHMVVCLVRMKIAQTLAEHIGKGIPPLYRFYNSQQQYVKRMVTGNMCPFVKKNSMVVLLIVMLINIDAMHPTKRSAIAHMTIDGNTINFLLLP